jgi:glycosyltransferase involved in cell wall biosynthesis
MKIALDCGALCSDFQFGTRTFTENFLQAVSLYDKKNKYVGYTFCPCYSQYKNIKIQRLPSFSWMNIAIPLAELVAQSDYFLALDQAIPLYTKSKIISFSHGLSFYYYPKLYKKDFDRLNNQLQAMVKRSEIIVVSSVRVKKEFDEIFPKHPPIKVIPFGIPFDMLPVRVERAQLKQKFFLFVGANHPIKNVRFLVEVFLELIKDKNYQDYKLYLVGNFDEYTKLHRNIRSFPLISRNELKKLYQSATAYLTASLYESFNFPLLEALSQGRYVIGLPSAIIPEMVSYVTVVKNKKEFISNIKNIKKTKYFLTDCFLWKTYIDYLNKIK